MALRVGLCIAGVTIVGAIGWLVSMPSGIEIVFNGLAIFGAAYLAAAAAWLGRRRAAASTRAAMVGTLIVLFLLELGLGVVLVELAGAKSTATQPALDIAAAVVMLGIGCGLLAGLRPRAGIVRAALATIPAGALLALVFEVGAGLEVARRYMPCPPYHSCAGFGPWFILTGAVPYALVMGIWLGAATLLGVVAARPPRARMADA
ncbi:MAG TPA: hypothetical protein VKC57_10375 [Ktedonobacterales bacterium]|nr:hypothetical protein [Ktedonobacterales bacterium]